VSDDALTPRLLGHVVVGEVPVELEGPHHVAASADGRELFINLSNYVPGTGSGPHGAHGTGKVPGSLIKLDARTGQKRGEALVDRSPGEVILSSDGRTAYVSHYDLLRLQSQLSSGAPTDSGFSTIALIDTESMRRLALLPVCPTAHGLALSADQATLYVTCSLSDELALVDVSRREQPAVIRKVAVGPTPGAIGAPSYMPYAVSRSPLDGTVWISNNASGDVRVYDPATGAMDPARVFPLGGVAMFGAFSLDGTALYVPTQGDDRVTRIDTRTGALQPLALPRASCLNAHAVVLRPDGKQGVVVCEGDHASVPGSIVWLTLDPMVVTGNVQLGLFPDGAAWVAPSLD
jgi:DNA-binding beta-propeller fold protein YncE